MSTTRVAVVRAAKWEILQYLCVAGCVPRKEHGYHPSQRLYGGGLPAPSRTAERVCVRECEFVDNLGEHQHTHTQGAAQRLTAF